MKTALLALCLAVAAALQAADPRPDLTLLNGQVLKRARIVSIKGDTALVVHTGGTSEIAADQLELATLVAAQKEIAASEEAQKKRTHVVAKQAEARASEAKQAAAAREKIFAADLAAKKLTTANAQPARARTDSLLKLKAEFPPKSSGSVRVQITDKTSRRGYPVKTHEDVIQYTVPSDDVWSWYRGTFQTATIEGISRTLDMVSRRIDDDMGRLGQIGGGESARIQAQQTQEWLQRTLQPYMERWRALVP